jgi:hypothetical protein
MSNRAPRIPTVNVTRPVGDLTGGKGLVPVIGPDQMPSIQVSVTEGAVQVQPAPAANPPATPGPAKT